MEPVLIYTDTSFEDAGAVQSFSLDMAFGSDEQDFEATFSEPKLNGGELLYIDGTEYGGIIDSIRQDTDNQATTYCGRTWHGMLAAKVVKPPANSNYYTASGDANACLAALVSYVGLSGVLTARSASSGISISNYQMPRFCNAYAGALGMLGSANAKLVIQRHDGITEVWAEPVSTIEDRADSDLMEFEVTENHRVPNHLVAAGQGELQDRVVVDLYADANGNVSTSQTFTGVDEIAVFYDYTGADAAELVKEGTSELKDYQSKGGADIKALAVGDWYVGDRLQVRDNRTGTVVTSTIAKKIVRVDMGVLSVDYEVGENVGTKAASYKSDITGISEGGGAFLPISGGTVTGDITVENVNATSGVVPSSNIFGPGIKFTDSQGNAIGYLRHRWLTNGNQGLQLGAQRYINGTRYYNETNIGVDSTGNLFVNFGSGATVAWRNALGLNTWTNVSVSDFATASSGWSFASSSAVQYNEALGAIRCLLQLTTSAAQTAGQKTVFTVKAAYRPKTFQASLSSLVSNAQAIRIFTTGDGAVNVSALSANASLYFNGVYFIGA